MAMEKHAQRASVRRTATMGSQLLDSRSRSFLQFTNFFSR